jgi:hypothetical protein
MPVTQDCPEDKDKPFQGSLGRLHFSLQKLCLRDTKPVCHQATNPQKHYCNTNVPGQPNTV